MMETNRAEQAVMRGIIAREHRKAAAERREAEDAYQAAAPEIAPSRAAWSTKSARSRKPSDAEKAVATAAADARKAWARHNPETAAAERTIRKERAEMLDRWGHKANGTPETHEHHSRPREGAMRRLYQSEAITADQFAAAIEIATVAEKIGADVAVKTASLETRVDVTRHGDGTFHEKLSQVRREMAYTRWRGRVRGPVSAVLEMVVGDVGLTIVARRHRMSSRSAKKLLLDALDLWPQILGAVRKEVDPATLAAAHAGIL